MTVRRAFAGMTRRDTIPPMRALLSLIALTVVLAGCGYKTPLKLPKPKPGEKPAATKPTPAENEQKPAGEP